MIEETLARLKYIVKSGSPTGNYIVTREGTEPLIAGNNAELLFILEKDITIELQKIRRDLYFLHGAALELPARARRGSGRYRPDRNRPDRGAHECRARLG